jgi:uncharacterized metal-binding protein YceD (DUF177 family)
MRIKIGALPKTGIQTVENLNQDQLNDRMNASPNNDIRFTTPPAVNIKVTPRAYGADGSGTITACFQQACARCQEYRDRDIKVSCNFTVKERPSPNEIEEDLSSLYSDDDYINLEEYCEESLILNMDSFWSPKFDKTGKCSDCGIAPTWNDSESEHSEDTFSLNSLLTNAIKKTQ